MEQVTIRLADAAKRYGQSKDHLYKLVFSGQLQHVATSRHHLLSVKELNKKFAPWEEA